MRGICTLSSLTQQEQILSQSQGGSLSPRGAAGGGGVLLGGNNEAKAVDIIQMLTKARTEYDKVAEPKCFFKVLSSVRVLMDSSVFLTLLSFWQSTSEPKEIGGSSVLCGNPNLIKPIPVKPNTQVKHTHIMCVFRLENITFLHNTSTCVHFVPSRSMKEQTPRLWP